MKKILAFLLLCCLLLTLAACTGTPSVQSVEINADGDLIVTLSDGSSYNAGRARGADGRDGAKGEPGERGEKGEQGEQGIQGERGEQGEPGENPFLETDTESFVAPNILADLTLTRAVGHCWSTGGYVTQNQYTARYTAINEMVAVMAGYTYVIPDFAGVVLLFDDNGGGQQLAQGTRGDFEFTVPDGKSQIGIAYLHTEAVEVTGVYRLTMTEQEQAALGYKSDRFSLSGANIKTDEVKALLAPLKGATVVNFGDSIFGNYRGEGSISEYLAQYTGATVYNCGFGGARMAGHSTENWSAFSMYSLAEAVATGDFSKQQRAVDESESEYKPAYFAQTLALLESIDFDEVDIITIAYGTNDFTGNNALDNENDPYDLSTYAGALRYSIKTILSAFPHIRIFICSQTYRFWNDEDGNFEADSDTYRSSVGLCLPDLVAKTEAVAREYHLAFIDNYYALGVNKWNRSEYFSATDGVHPNQNGRRLIAAHIAKALY